MYTTLPSNKCGYARRDQKWMGHDLRGRRAYKGKELFMVVGDLIEVPEIKTVIQLKDIEKLELRQMILNSFIVTAEVRQI